MNIAHLLMNIAIFIRLHLQVALLIIVIAIMSGVAIIVIIIAAAVRMEAVLSNCSHRFISMHSWMRSSSDGRHPLTARFVVGCLGCCRGNLAVARGARGLFLHAILQHGCARI